MTSRERQFIYDFTAHNGWRWRLEIIPAQAANSTNQTSLTTHTIPAEMGFVSADIKLTGGFDKQPIGIAKTPSLTLKFDLDALTGATEWTDLREALLSPTVTGAMYSNLGVAFGALGGQWLSYSVDCTSYNVLTLRTDRGDSGVTMSAADVVFQGCQRRSPKRRLGLSDTKAQWYEVECYHVSRAVLEQVTLPYLSYYLQNLGTWQPDYAILYDAIYGSDGYKIEQKSNYANNLQIHCSSLEDLRLAVNEACSAVYRGFVRSNSAAFSVPSVITAQAGSPILLYERTDGTPDVENDYGAAIQLADTYFHHAIVQFGETDSLWNAFDDKLFLGKYENWWDVLRDSAEVTFSKRNFYNTSATAVAGYACKIWGATPNVPATTTIDSAFVLQSGDITADLDDMLLRGARCNVLNVGEDDTNKFEAFNTGSDSENDFDIPTVWHTMPTITGKVWSGNGANFDDDAPARGKLFTRGDRGRGWGDVAITLHEHCYLDDGIDDYELFDHSTLPAYSPYNEYPPPYILARQQVSWSQSVAEAVLAVFSKSGQTLITADCDIDNALPDYTGSTYTFSPSSFKLWLSGVIGTTAVLVETECDVVGGTASAKFLVRGV